jgi:hypothetical protein
MSYNGSGTFTINSTGQPVVAGTVITASAFNALTTDLATGLTTAITKDGQTTTTARITFAQGFTSSLVTDSSSVSTGSIITDGGVGIAKNLYVGGTLNVTGSTTLTNPVINNIKMGYTTTATAAGTTTLTVASNYRQFFTGTSTQTIVLPVTSTLVTGMAYEIENNSTGLLTVNSSGGNLVGTIPAGVCAHAVCIGTTLTTAADWDWDYISTTTITGTGANVLGTSPTITTPTISSLSSAAATALTLQSAGTTAVTIDTSQRVGIGTTSPTSTYRTSIKGDYSSIIGGVEFDNGGGDKMAVSFASATSPSFIFANQSSTGVLRFDTNATERMRIESGGSVLVGTTSNIAANAKIFAQGSGKGIAVGYGTGSSAYRHLYMNNADATLYFFNDTNYASLSGAGAWTNASDARLKKNIVDIKYGLSDVLRLQPRSYQMNSVNGDFVGFIAQELQTVIPEVVSGDPEKQLGVDYGSLVAVAFKAIQELKAINDTQAETINALTARITALENA